MRMERRAILVVFAGLVAACSASERSTALTQPPSDEAGVEVPFDGAPATAREDAAVRMIDAATSAPGTPGSGRDGALDPSDTATPPGRLSPADSASVAGPYAAVTEDGVGPDGRYSLFRPAELGRHGELHPVVLWGPGALSWPAVYRSLLERLASHGFVVLSFGATPDGPELTAGLDWLVAEHGRSRSALFGKLDLAHAAAGGHSAGSLATFKVASDPRWTTTVHLQGGTFDPHTDVQQLRAPAAFFCGESDIAEPNCSIDFANTAVPTVYGLVRGADHVALTELSSGGQREPFVTATVAWLRLWLAGDEAYRHVFFGDDCTLCTDAGWTYRRKGF